MQSWFKVDAKLIQSWLCSYVDNTVCCIAEMSKLHTVQSGFGTLCSVCLFSEMLCDEKKAEQSDPHKQLLEHGFCPLLNSSGSLKGP